MGKPWYYDTKPPVGYRDPITERVLDVISGLSDKDAVKGSYVSPQTIKRWRNGTTRQPHYLTMQSVLWAHGFEMTLKRRRNQ